MIIFMEKNEVKKWGLVQVQTSREKKVGIGSANTITLRERYSYY